MVWPASSGIITHVAMNIFVVQTLTEVASIPPYCNFPGKAYDNAMSTHRMQVRDLPPEFAAKLDKKTPPDREIEVTLEEVPDYSDVPDEVLEAQRKGIRSRMTAGDRASPKEVQEIFKKLTK